MLMVMLACEEPLNSQRVWLVLSWEGKMSMYNCAWACSKGDKASRVAATTKAPKAKGLRPGGGGGTCILHDSKRVDKGVKCKIILMNSGEFGFYSVL